MKIKHIIFLSLMTFICNAAFAVDIGPMNANDIMLINAPASISINQYSSLFVLFPEGKVTLDVLKANKEALLTELGRTESYYRCYQLESEAKATLLLSFIGSKGKKYVAQSDFMQYTEKEIEGNKKRIGYLIRIQADISSIESNVNLNGLFALGVAAKAKQISGSLAVQIYGLSGNQIAGIVNQQFTLTEESLMRAIEGVAVLKSKIQDTAIIVCPDELPDSLDKK